MSKYKTGDKVVMEITKGKTLLGTDYYLFNDGFGIRQGLVELNAEPLTTYTEQARADGAETAWELAKKCMLMTDRERETIFGSGHNALYGVLTYFDYKHAAAKVAEWEKAKEEIKVGDILEDIADNNVKCVVVKPYSSNMAYLVFSDGSAGLNELDNLRKTGRHTDIDSFLKQIRGQNNA